MTDDKKIKLIALDVDGTLTNGGIIYGDSNLEIKCFNVKDGLAIAGAIKLGYIVAIITGRVSDVVKRRAQDLGITDVYQGIANKVYVLEELCKKYKITKDEIAYMGDDLNDYSAIEYSYLTAAPRDAVDEILNLVDLVSEKNGGEGAVREFIEYIMKKDNLWNKLVERYKNIGGTN